MTKYQNHDTLVTKQTLTFGESYWKSTKSDAAPALKAAGTHPCTFKKKMFQGAFMHDGRLKPSFNRRKHALSHALKVQHQHRLLSKLLGRVSQNQIKNSVGLSLQATHAYVCKSDRVIHTHSTSRCGAPQACFVVNAPQKSFKGSYANVMYCVQSQSDVILGCNVSVIGHRAAQAAYKGIQTSRQDQSVILERGFKINTPMTLRMHRACHTLQHSWVQPGDILVV